jgi:sec-independent protein translocase protein TatA
MLSNVSVWQLLIIMIIFVLLFGTKRIRQLGEDLGGMIAGFKKETKGIKTVDVIKDVNSARKTVKKAKGLFKK